MDTIVSGDKMYATGMTDRYGAQSEIFAGKVVKHDRTKRGMAYALVEGDVPQSGQRQFRLYEGRYGHFGATAGLPKLDAHVSGLPAIGARVSYSLIPDRFRKDAQMIAAAGPEAEFLSATMCYRAFGNNHHRYRMAEKEDLLPGAELILASLSEHVNPGTDPSIGAIRVRMADEPIGRPNGVIADYALYEVLEPLAFKGNAAVPLENFLCNLGYLHQDISEKYVPVVKLEPGEVAEPGSVCTSCGVWVAQGNYHKHDSWDR